MNVNSVNAFERYHSCSNHYCSTIQ